jgi:glycerol kinase
VQRAKIQETSALGVAYLAGLQMGLYSSLDEIKLLWQSNQYAGRNRFNPRCLPA